MKITAEKIESYLSVVKEIGKVDEDFTPLVKAATQLSYEIQLLKLRQSVTPYKGTDLKVQIGCGKIPLDGFINVDIFDPCDMKADIRVGLPFEPEACKLIFAEHVLEHLDYPKSVQVFLKSCHSCLQAGGELIISVPDCGKVLDAYSRDHVLLEHFHQDCYSRRPSPPDNSSPINVVNLLFRDEFYRENYTNHLWAYDEALLNYLLKEAGFARVSKITPPEYSNKRRWPISIYIKGSK